jgi:hypothetical protein
MCESGFLFLGLCARVEIEERSLASIAMRDLGNNIGRRCRFQLELSV